MSRNEQIDRALSQALACREDRKRAQATLDTLRRKEEDAIEHLQEMVQGCETRQSPGGSHD